MHSTLYPRLLEEPDLMNAVADLPKSEKWKRFPPFLSAACALKIILRYEECIRFAAQKESVPLSAVIAVLFRERLGYGFEDLLDRFRANASRGLGQIRPLTACRADEALGLPPLPLSDYRKKLMQPDFNILYCARILRVEVSKSDQNTLKPSKESLEKAFTRYNGSPVYGRNVLRYHNAIEHSLAEESSSVSKASAEQL